MKTLPLPHSEHLANTRALSLAARGAFIDLLCVQAERGFAPSKEDDICRAIGILPSEWREIKSEVIPLFIVTDEGMQHEATAKAIEKKARISRARKDAAEKRWGKKETPVSLEHMEGVAARFGIPKEQAREFYENQKR